MQTQFQGTLKMVLLEDLAQRSDSLLIAHRQHREWYALSKVMKFSQEFTLTISQKINFNTTKLNNTLAKQSIRRSLGGLKDVSKSNSADNKWHRKIAGVSASRNEEVVQRSYIPPILLLIKMHIKAFRRYQINAR